MEKVSAMEVNQRVRRKYQNDEVITISKWRVTNLDFTSILYASAPFPNRDDILSAGTNCLKMPVAQSAHQMNGSSSYGRREAFGT